MNRPNPYSTGKPWNDETLAAYQTMPQHGGYVVALDYVEDRALEQYEAQWREWCRKQPRHLWPTWLDGWKERKRMRVAR